MRIGILTSGGDAPGMNAAIRAAAVVALALGHEPIGIRHGYRGLVNGELAPLDALSVADVLRRGGVELPNDPKAYTDPDAAHGGNEVDSTEPTGAEPAAESAATTPARSPAKPAAKQSAVPATVSMRALHDGT